MEKIDYPVYTAILQYDLEDKQYFMDVVLSKPISQETDEEYFIFPIDEKIELISFFGEKLIPKDGDREIFLSITPGDYEFNDKIGTYGGYRILLSEY